MTVITLSREFGSGGDEIPHMICRSNGYQKFDKEMIAAAARATALAIPEIEVSENGGVAFSEGEYRAGSFLDRLLRKPAPAAEVRVWRESPDGIQTVATTQLDEDQVRGLVQEAVTAAYRRGNFVIIGRAGQVILRDLPGVLHVRVIASIDERILRVRDAPDFAESTSLRLGVAATQYDIRLAAQDLIESHDAASQDYLKRNYGVNWDDPNLYDVIINTTHLNLVTAAHMIVEAAKMLDAID